MNSSIKEHPRCKGWFLEEDKRMGLFYGWWYAISKNGIKIYASDPELEVTITVVPS